MLRLAVHSLWNRRGSACLVLLAIALSTALLIGVERLRVQARASFTNTLYGTDLVVGARTGPISLLLYSVFRIGDATSNLSTRSYAHIAALPAVAWAVPISLGDSHQGFPVLGTNASYFEHYRYGNNQALVLDTGSAFDNDAEAVLGASVAKRLGYSPGQHIVLAHGMGAISFSKHRDHPFTVVGVLAPTGTPVDQTVHVSLAGIEAMHAHLHGGHGAAASRRLMINRHDEGTLTAVLLGLKNRANVLTVQRYINTFTEEPLLAILPSLTLQQLWDLVALAENAMRVVAALVLLVSLTVMAAALLTSLNERRREMAILRALGARPRHVFGLILGESLLLTVLGAVLGVLLLQAATAIATPRLETAYGMVLSAWPPSLEEWRLLAATLISGLVAGTLPALLAYRHSVADGMSIRL